MRRFLSAMVLLAALATLSVMGYRAGALRLNYPSYFRFPVRGIDVSHHQGQIDWPSVASAGVHFAFIKATEGQDHADSRFQENWASAAAAGVARGAYHFFTFCTPGDLQAEHFLGTVPEDRGELPPVADVEFSGNCRAWTSIPEIRAQLSVFLETIEDGFGRKPIVYLTSHSHARIVSGHFDGYALWVRDIVFEPSSYRYGQWAFWQYADNGRIDGIRGPVDLNVYCCRERPGWL